MKRNRCIPLYSTLSANGDKLLDWRKSSDGTIIVREYNSVNSKDWMIYSQPSKFRRFLNRLINVF